MQNIVLNFLKNYIYTFGQKSYNTPYQYISLFPFSKKFRKLF